MATNKVDLGLVRQLSQCTAEIQRLKLLVAEKDRQLAEKDAKISTLLSSKGSQPPAQPAAGKEVPNADSTPLNTATGLNPFILHLMQNKNQQDSDSDAVDSTPPEQNGLPTKGDVADLLDDLHETSTSAIRRRSMDRMKAGGAAPKAQPSDTGYRKLFQKSTMLKFDRDSPQFRRTVQDLGENVEGLREHIQRLVSITRQYRQVGTQFGDLGRSLAEEMMHLKGDAWFKRLGALAPVLVRFGESIDEIQGYQDIFLESLENVFAAPMEAFAKREVKEMRLSRKAVTRSREEYEDVLAKYLSFTKKAGDSGNKFVDELAATKRRFELARFDQVCSLNQLETRKKFQLVERMCSALYANLGFFHQCHTVVATLEPTMRDLNHQLQLARREFAQEQRLWTAKRERLEKQLNKGSFPHMSQQRRVSLSGGASMLNLLKDESSGKRQRSTSSFGLDGDGSLVDDVVKAGFLFKRSNNMRRDWKRRWFYIQGGKLYYQRESKDKGYKEKDGKDKDRDKDGGSTLPSDDEEEVAPATRRKSEQLSGLVKGLKAARSLPMKRGSIKKDHAHKGHGGAKFEEPVEVCDILLCTVRQSKAEANVNAASTSRRFTFEVISPNNRPYMLQAQSETEMMSWIKVIQSEIGSELAKQCKEGAGGQGKGGGGGGTGRDAMEEAEHQEWVSHCQRLRQLNPVCADCGATHPEWASINLGLMMCIECSGVHRMLGVHISKVRSLTLDEWPRSVRLLMEAVGNGRSNAIWEGRLEDGADSQGGRVRSVSAVVDGEKRTFTKPGEACTRESREAWIRDKYQYRRFVLDASLSPSSTQRIFGQDGGAGGGNADGTALSRQLCDAVAAGDVPTVLHLIALGANVNAPLTGPGQKRRTAVHVACARGQLVCLELLLTNGASMYALDEDELAPLDYAMGRAQSGGRAPQNREVGSEECMALLVSKLEDGGDQKK